ncbi:MULTISPECIES: hypothetical protein [Pseudomonas]|jgi:hypothetical protein|uniref:Uncharacterized protein n=1 Tax=Pseudomonas congelans TaxID=200452 RepID=A0A0P9LUU3_9PSED|nr:MULTISPECIES: hypothetical protein [Pseudomonas]KFE48537.1 hypothetical protein IV03_04090 [Pseudomonas congelans]KPW82009.1 Unknown protein sequence [Pseudomonas congelans]MBC8800323.1 hypothetical protein [Pseudomonas congelans]MBP1144310.1 Spy/CpxP family protein refolding chaperone [Pseudomonas sp. PvP027]MCF5165687.1 hypothetical protein [Pseudomonas congelans]
MKIKLYLAIVLAGLPCLSLAAGPSPSACAQAHSAASQRLAEATAEQDGIAAGNARRQLATVVAQCQAAQQQRQQLQNSRQNQQRQRQQQLNYQRNVQRRIVEQQRLRQQMQQQRINNQNNMPDIRY